MDSKTLTFNQGVIRGLEIALDYIKSFRLNEPGLKTVLYAEIGTLEIAIHEELEANQ